jgi:hypothetical protein
MRIIRHRLLDYAKAMRLFTLELEYAEVLQKNLYEHKQSPPAPPKQKHSLRS